MRKPVPRKEATGKPGFPCKSEDCYAVRHMTASEFVVYDTMLAFAIAGRKARGGEGPLIFKTALKPTLANAVNRSINSISEAKDSLVEAGWLRLIREGIRRDDGRQAPNEYEVIKHEQFAASHPGSCPLYDYCPDFETATAHEIRIGDTLGDKGTTPENFRDKMTSLALKSYEKTLPEQGFLVSDAVPAKVGTEMPVPKMAGTVVHIAVPGKSGSPYPPNPVDRTRKTGVAVPEIPGRSLCTTDLEIQTTTTTTAGDERRGSGELIKTLSDMWRQENKTVPEITPANRREIADLEKTHGQERMVKIFAAYVKAPSPFKTITTFPFSRFVTNFENFASHVDQPTRQPLTGKEPWLLKCFAEQDKKLNERFKAKTKEEQEVDRLEFERLRDEF
ncbi:MAG TPA: hypothetical protein VMI32_05080 [Candidatus Solibacter sp.]|nr:hypothetical protein [Candidatus Solibacter sp.]